MVNLASFYFAQILMELMSSFKNAIFPNCVKYCFEQN